MYMTLSFHHPQDVADHPQLEPEVKRAILASWASDAAAVKDRPALRRLPKSRRVVAIDEILGALKTLDS
jgi:hypothetical protein